jgi:misacylated tRNA(Ala) deacylase
VNLQLAYADAYARTVEATVVAVDESQAGGPLVILDRTVFYPGGGGQPADRGSLIRAADGRQWMVVGARKQDGEIVHELAPPGAPTDGANEEGTEGQAAEDQAAQDQATDRHPVEPPRLGDVVTVDLEWARRYALMRTHTALHALCGVVWRDYGAQVTGGNMEPGAGRMDFEFERMNADLVAEIEAKVNAELHLLPPGIPEVRTIEIVGLDLQADGGTHVANTREVGGIRVTGYESKGRINKRIRIELGVPPSAS